MPPVISLLSDFGNRSAYVAQAKARLKSLCPGCEFIDVSHEARVLLTAAWLVHTTWRHFPAGSLHLVMVEPGAHSATLLVARQGHVFVGPDNGVLTCVLPGAGIWCGPPDSSNFKARDLYPELVAGYLSGGLALADFEGAPVQLVMLAPQVVAIDSFGNLITNVPVEQLGRGLGLNGWRINRVVGNYGDVAAGQVALMAGSDATIEIVASGSSAAGLLQARLGQRLELLAAPDF